MYKGGPASERPAWHPEPPFLNVQSDSLRNERLSDACMMRLNRAKEAATGRLDENENLALANQIQIMSAPWGQECRLATLNSNGISDNTKRDAAALFLLSFAIDICVISETHLRVDEMVDVRKYFLEYGYRVGANCCRKLGKGIGKSRARGGGDSFDSAEHILCRTGQNPSA